MWPRSRTQECGMAVSRDGRLQACYSPANDNVAVVRRACGGHGLAVAVWTSARRVVGRVGLAWRGILETESNRGTAAANHKREQMCSGGRVWAGQLSAVSRRGWRLVTDSRTSRQSMAQHGSTRSQKPSRARHVNMPVRGRECAAGCRQNRTEQNVA